MASSFVSHQLDSSQSAQKENEKGKFTDVETLRRNFMPSWLLVVMLTKWYVLSTVKQRITEFISRKFAAHSLRYSYWLPPSPFIVVKRNETNSSYGRTEGIRTYRDHSTEWNFMMFAIKLSPVRMWRMHTSSARAQHTPASTRHMSDCLNCSYQFFMFDLLLCPLLLDAACTQVWFWLSIHR